MATVKICTTENFCIRCANTTSQEVADTAESLEKQGKKYLCCGNQCVRLDQITTIVEESKAPPDTDDEHCFGDVTVVKPKSMVINY